MSERFMLAKPYDDTVDPAGWWISEKLDGVRAMWDGKALITRKGNRLAAPDWWTKGLPEVPLDGELWAGRRRFEELCGIVGRAKPHDRWGEVFYMVFDAPAQPGPFEARLDYLDNLMLFEPARLHVHRRCLGPRDLSVEMGAVLGAGGEGVMLRMPRSGYEPGCTGVLLKLKPEHDAEAVVYGYVDGLGRNMGRAGALRVRTAAGVEFRVGSGLTDRLRQHPPVIGATITYAFTELTKSGKPRHPRFVRVRSEP